MGSVERSWRVEADRFALRQIGTCFTTARSRVPAGGYSHNRRSRDATRPWSDRYRQHFRRR